MNINTKEYWNKRFETGDWEMQNGKEQTTQFALSQIPLLKINNDFDGFILDFGCGLGDAIPLYHKAFPKAQLIGMDISEAAIEQCKVRYGNIASFICGNYLEVPSVDIIISSNVFEHLSNDKFIAKELLTKCKQLYLFTPYNENLVFGSEHVNTYLPNYYEEVSTNYSFKVFKVKDHSENVIELLWNIYIKNLIRFFLKKSLARPRLQIMFFFQN